ncbi:MAG TPA: DinB family protein [Chitinophagaceae bacterium]|nr:DinB family protein [Chitinophagaceae bacterium]
MNKEINTLIRRIENVNSGEPWFGRAVYSILDEIDPKRVYERPNGSAHSLIELLYHMITWAEFTLNRLEKNPINDLAAAEALDWRTIDPKMHTWKKGSSEFRSIHNKIIKLLKKKDDTFLEEIVDYRKYNYGFLINGMIEHNIYHLGQVAYLKKLCL